MSEVIDFQKKIESYARGYAQINLDAIVANMTGMKAKLSEKTRMIGVIKSDGYGHGSVPIAKALQPLDFMYGFAVASPEEGHILRMSGIQKPILVLGYTFPYSYERMVEEEIRPAVFRMDSIKPLAESARKCGRKVKVHIKVDTGMGRIGITPDEEGMRFVKALLEEEWIEIEGIFTHFAKADEQDKTHAREQYHKFSSFIQRLEDELGLQIPLKHCSNSAGILDLPEVNMDLVRAGITLYGLYPSDEVNKEAVSLQPALSLHSHVVYIKTIHAGDTVSYGGTFVAGKDTKVATIPLGYADGYPRALSGKGCVLIRGQKAPILGRVCMDQFMVDVTDVEGATEGDLVTLLGFDGEEHISAEFLGELSGRFNYELVCDINKRIPRVYLMGGQPVYVKDYYDDYQ